MAGGGAAEGLVYGLHAVRAALERDPAAIKELRLAEETGGARLVQLRRLAARAGVPVIAAAGRELDLLTAGGRHQGAVAVRAARRAPRAEDGLAALLDGLTGDPFLLVLDGVQDPRNLGACLRSADAAGVHAVLTPKDRSAGLTPAACKAASGAAEALPFFQVTNLARTLRGLKEHGIWLVGADAAAPTAFFAADLRGPLALILGGEEQGLRRLTREHCDLLVAIPMAGTVESLNVSVAAAVLMFEALRQRS